jgi:ribosomal protein L11 methylase PrmA
MDAVRVPGSYRDPAGHVFEYRGEIFRSINRVAQGDFSAFLDSVSFRDLRAQSAVVGTEPVERAEVPVALEDDARLVRHERVPFVSYPYEWPFALLKRAALLHLRIQIACLEDGFSLSDASAYNVQFRGPEPVFIDMLSFRRYREGEMWAGQRQFLAQFLNPLLLQSVMGVPYQDWYRGSPEGIPSRQLAALVPWHRSLSFGMLAHVKAPARMEARVAANQGAATATARSARLPKAHYLGLLRQLEQWIATLVPRGTGKSTWQDYDRNNTYDDAEQAAKRAFVSRFAAETRPALLVDIGCNTGEYSEVALRAGARGAVGLDFDHGALDKACHRAIDQSLNFLPLYQDAANPSPGLGWRQTERSALGARGPFDAVIALAVEHHLAIGRNLPLDDVVAFLVEQAPTGILEFVPKSDPTVQIMLALREDIFPDHTQDKFEAALKQRARIVRQETVSASGRVLYQFDRG